MFVACFYIKGKSKRTDWLVDTTSGMFMNKFEVTWMGLSGSTTLVGRK